MSSTIADMPAIAPYRWALFRYYFANTFGNYSLMTFDGTLHFANFLHGTAVNMPAAAYFSATFSGASFPAAW